LNKYTEGRRGRVRMVSDLRIIAGNINLVIYPRSYLYYIY